MTAFHDKRVFITGAGQGIGCAACLAFAQAGAVVALNDHDSTLAQTAAHTINQHIGADRVTAYPGDVSDVDALTALIDSFSQRHGGLDIAIANAGITRYVPFLHSTPADFDRILGVNVRGTYFTAQAAARHMIAHRIAGRILLTSSVVGMQTHVNFSMYSTTKAAIQMMARALAIELGEFGITVNAISPGATLTERAVREDADYQRNWSAVTPTGRVGYVEDVAAAMLFLASPQARQITGQNLIIDGGWTLRSPLPAAAANIPDQPDYA
jgi:3-oxoacyl-[acyl-carrier protein] reductase